MNAGEQSWLPDFDEARTANPFVMSRERKTVSAGGRDDQAVCRIAMETGRQSIQLDHYLDI